MGNEVDVLINGQHNILAILGCQRRQVDMPTWNIYALMSSQHTIILHLCNDSRSIDANHQHIQGTIIKKHMVTLLNICRKVLIREIDDIMRRVYLWTTEQLHYVARLIRYGFSATRCTHLRTFGVNQYADMSAYLAHVPYYILYPLLRCMSRIHSNHIHTSIIELADEVHITATVTDRSNNLCLFHSNFLINFLQSYEKNKIFEKKFAENFHIPLKNSNFAVRKLNT